MKYHVGLDVSMDETSVCVMDETGKVIYEAKVPTDPDDIAVYLRSSGLEYERIGLESGPCSPWLYQGLIDKGLPAICIDARHASAALKAQNFKTDKNDAMGIAHIMRTGWYRISHVKSDHSQKTRVLLNSRKTLLGKRLELDNHIRGTLKVFGLKVGATTASRFDKRVRDLIADDQSLLVCLEPLLQIRSHIIVECNNLDKIIRNLVQHDELCRKFMTIPGVGFLTALMFKCTIDNPHRFKKSANVGVHLGLTPRKYASGEIDYNGRITKTGDWMMRAHLYEAAQVLMRRTSKTTELKVWGQKIAKRSCKKCAYVAIARKLSVIMHRMWVDGTEFQDGGAHA